MDNFKVEKELWEKGYKYIACIDEVGRGCLAGEVLACAVVMPRDVYFEEITDSKKISIKKRILLSKIIKENALAYSFGTASPIEIDKLNIKKATLKAMRIAVENLKIDNDIKIYPDMLLIDAEKISLNIPQKSIIKGDLYCHGISAASILAKVERDNRIIELVNNNNILKKYDLENNKGYGTKKHIEAIQQHGPTEFHRKTFLKKILNNNKQISLSDRDIL